MNGIHRWLLAVVAPALLLAASTLARTEDGSPAGENEAKLLEVLASDASTFDKAKACQRLAVVGTKKAVPALKKLLSVKELAHYARFGLEPIPDPSVDGALREAMGELKGELLIGVVNSIGVRRDEGAMDGLQQLLAGDDPRVAAAAAAAVGRIATTESARTLRQALQTAGDDLRPGIADACLPCAESLLAAGNAQAAVALYDSVREAKVPRHIQLAGLRGAILARGERGVSLLADEVENGDDAAFRLALTVARELPAAQASRALAVRAGEVSDARRPLVITALGDIGDPTGLPAVLEAAKDGPSAVRVAALRALETLGDASAVPVLLEAAAGKDAEIATAAQETLAGLGGAEIDRAIVAALQEGNPARRAALFEIVGRRGIRSAVPALRGAASSENTDVRLAAIKALGETVSLADLTILTGRLAEPRSAEEVPVVVDALKTACARMPDRAACADKLAAAMADAPVAARCQLLEAFAPIGGERALEAVTKAAQDPDEKVRDAAIQVLSAWQHEDAARKLLDLFKAAKSEKERMRYLDGFSQIVLRLGFQKEKRIGITEEAMELSSTAEERHLVIKTFAGIPAPETLAILRTYFEKPELREAACEAAVTISERLVRTKREAVVAAMQEVARVSETQRTLRRARRLLRETVGTP